MISENKSNFSLPIRVVVNWPLRKLKLCPLPLPFAHISSSEMMQEILPQMLQDISMASEMLHKLLHEQFCLPKTKLESEETPQIDVLMSKSKAHFVVVHMFMCIIYGRRFKILLFIAALFIHALTFFHLKWNRCSNFIHLHFW